MARLTRRERLNRRVGNPNAAQTIPQNIFNFSDELFLGTDSIHHDIPLDNRLDNMNTPIQQLNNDLQNNQNWVRVAHINARSVPGHLPEISRIVSETNLDILGISETFIKNDTSEHKYNIENYKLYTENRTHTTQGGVGIYVKDNINVKTIPVPKNVKHPELICLELTIKNIKIAVVCVYKGLGLSYTTFSHIFF